VLLLLFPAVSGPLCKLQPKNLLHTLSPMDVVAHAKQVFKATTVQAQPAISELASDLSTGIITLNTTGNKRTLPQPASTFEAGDSHSVEWPAAHKRSKGAHARGFSSTFHPNSQCYR
jgi:hypothetical protein